MRFNRLVPELYCSDFERSLAFYTETLGFAVSYARSEERFAFLDREGAQIMIEQPGDDGRAWLAGELAYPYGRVSAAAAAIVSRSFRCGVTTEFRSLGSSPELPLLPRLAAAIAAHCHAHA